MCSPARTKRAMAESYGGLNPYGLMAIFSFLIWLLWSVGGPFCALMVTSRQPLLPYYICAWALFCALVLYGGTKSWLKVRIPPGSKWIVFYAVWVGFSIFWTDTPNIVFTFVNWGTDIMWCAAVVITVGRDDKAVILRSAIWGIVVGSCLHVVSWLYLGEVGKVNWDAGGTAVHKNLAGAYVGLGLLCAIFLTIRSQRTSSRVATMALVIVLGGFLVASSSKGPIIAALFALLTLLMLEKRRLGSKLSVSVAVASAVAFSVILIQELSLSYLAYINNPQQVRTLTGRTELWLLIIDLVKEAPVIGHGFMWIAFHPPLIWAGQAHNDILQQLLEYGAVGLGLALAMYTDRKSVV